MRKVILCAILIVVSFLFISCKDSLPRRFSSLISSVEEYCSVSTYSESYWMNVGIKYQKLYDEFKAEKSSFTSDEKREIYRCIARYEYLRVNSFVSYVEDLSSEFSEDEWLSANERIKELASEYLENRHAYNSSEKRSIDAVILHYFGIVMHSKIPGIVDNIRSVLRELGLSF